MLELKNLCYQAQGEDGPADILRNISLTVADGRLVAVTGPNGGGKTTLAKAIMGLVEPTGGQILWNGADVTGLNVTQRAGLGISYSFQQPPRFKGLRVRDLLELAAGKSGLSQEECCQYLNRVGLCAGDYIDREVDASLSGGEVKRIEIATILARPAGLMIFDEPEAGIDLWSFSRLTDTFRAIHESRKSTLLIITHQERILSLADEIILVAAGRVSMQGPRDEIFPEILDATAGCSYRTGGERGECL
ncbi:MAG: ATP-binding cassette domain-containing protein [Oscillospiraceae bacterium]|nr:ATP-binding cassette domain-containing protein [Oscillospiraceae bacterium]